MMELLPPIARATDHAALRYPRIVKQTVPYVARKKFWDLYANCSHLLAEVKAITYENHDAHSKRIFDANDWRSYRIDDEMIEKSRRAYFSNISYLDDKIGELLTTLE